MSAAWAAEKPNRDQTYFCNLRSPLRSRSAISHSRFIVFCYARSPLRSVQFSAHSAPFPLRSHALPLLEPWCTKLCIVYCASTGIFVSAGLHGHSRTIQLVHVGAEGRVGDVCRCWTLPGWRQLSVFASYIVRSATHPVPENCTFVVVSYLYKDELHGNLQVLLVLSFVDIVGTKELQKGETNKQKI